MNCNEYEYDDYSDWSKTLAKNYTKKELQKRLNDVDKLRDKYKRSHFHAIERSASMQGCSQARAQSGNVVRSNWDEYNAINNALEIHERFPKMAKQEGDL